MREAIIPIHATTRTSLSRKPRGVHQVPQPGCGHLAGCGASVQKFREARKIVTKHYQWMVRTDYLPRICATDVVRNVFTEAARCSRSARRRRARRRCRSSSRWPRSGSGTAWCATQYSWNSVFEPGTLVQLFQFSHLSGALSGGRSRASGSPTSAGSTTSDSSRRPTAALVVPAAKFNRAMRIDTKLVNPLATLPNLTFRTSAARTTWPSKLLRANCQTATGQQMAQFFKPRASPYALLSQIVTATAAPTSRHSPPPKNALLNNTLWCGDHSISRLASAGNGVSTVERRFN